MSITIREAFRKKIAKANGKFLGNDKAKRSRKHNKDL